MLEKYGLDKTQSNSQINLKTSASGKNQSRNQWWVELTHGGMLLSPVVVDEMFPEGPGTIDSKRYEKLYDGYIRYLALCEKNEDRVSSGFSDGLHKWLDAIFEGFLEIGKSNWLKEQSIPDNLKSHNVFGDLLRPNRVLQFYNGFRYAIKVDKISKRLGLGKGKTEYTKFVELLRKTQVQLGVLTNGDQIRLIYAGLDHDSWVQWAVSQWFEESSGTDLLAGFSQLCGRPFNMNSDLDKELGNWALLHYVQYSRIKQSDLSTVLGEQVREAVEILLQTLDQGVKDFSLLLKPLESAEISNKARLNALYQAAIRIVMRMVVVFFAEARELFPRSLEAYDQSYGIEGLFRILKDAEQDEGFDALINSTAAWQRLLSLFKLISDGSAFSDIPINPYGGILFRTGNPTSDDLTLRAVSIFENSQLRISDQVILTILRKMKIGKVKIKRGRSYTWVSGVVDFSELSAEYIGIMYEGLLDYQVRKVTPEEQAIVILKLGQQPALPLSRLESLNDSELTNLITNLSKEKFEKVIKTEGSEEETQSEEEEGEEELLEEARETEDSEADSEDSGVMDNTNMFTIEHDDLYHRVLTWAKKAAEKAKFIKRDKKKSDANYQKELNQAALRIFTKDKVYREGSYYLIQNSGNRKGSGTFYTKPQLVIPTVHRTLEPLLYSKNADELLVPKEPQEILDLKVLDPAMGSASFLVAAVRYLTEGLYESLVCYKKKKFVKNKTTVSIPLGTPANGTLKEETFTFEGLENDPFIETQIKSRLKRYIVERCIYGVDINPLAVELAKLSLWVETLDKALPFTFLDHKLKNGNSIVGCALNDFRDYPVVAWERDAGDSSFNNGVNYKKKEWSNSLDKFRDEVIKPQMVESIRQMSSQTKITEYIAGLKKSASIVKDKIALNYQKLHNFEEFDITKVSDNQKKEDFYINYFLNDPETLKIKELMDLWCAIWFWSPDKLEICPTPQNYLNLDNKIQSELQILKEKYKFFHWEIEFPDVFFKETPGFDAILGNPPWERFLPSSMEFFSEFDPIYRTYGKQDALKEQKAIFIRIPNVEREWLSYNADFKAYSHWIKHLSNPFGDYTLGSHFNLLKSGSDWRNSNKLHEAWRHFREQNAIESTLQRGFSLRGDLATYKIFLEIALNLLSKRGLLGLILPSSLYSDQNAKALREKLFDHYSVEYIFSFENRKKIFPSIHGSFKFCILICKSGKEKDFIRTAFMRHDLNDWEHPDPYLFQYTLDAISKFSVDQKALMEIDSEQNFKLLDKIYTKSALFAEKEKSGWDIEYIREFDQTGDSQYFEPLPNWLQKDFQKDPYCRWIGPNGEIAWPFYVGRMVGQYDFSKKGWVSGKGRTAVWRKISFEEKTIEPEFLMSKDIMDKLKKNIYGYKISFMDISSSTNERSFICYLGRDNPHSHKAPILYLKDHSLMHSVFLLAMTNSFIFDYVARFKFTGLSLTYNKLEEMPIIPFNKISMLEYMLLSVTKVSFIHILYAPDWLYIATGIPKIKNYHWRRNWAISYHERTRIRSCIEAVIAYFFGLNFADLQLILNDDITNPRGFWRIDKDKPKDIRLTTLTLKAYEYLSKVGIEKFCEEDWQIPEEIQQQYKKELGPRFLDWQTAGSVEGSWKECEEHARNILGDDFDAFMQDIKEGKDPFAIRALKKEQEREIAKAESHKKVKRKTMDEGALDKVLELIPKTGKPKSIEHNTRKLNNAESQKKEIKSMQKKLG